MTYEQALLGLMVGGVTFSFLAWRMESWRKSMWFRIVGASVWFAFAIFATRALAAAPVNNAASAFYYLVSMGVGMLCWAGFILFWSVESISAFVRRSLGLEDMKIQPPTSMAEGAVARKEYDRAEQLYRELITDFPKEPKPCRGLAEMLLEVNRPNEALALFRRAESLADDVSEKMTDRFAQAEIIADRIGDVPGAIRVIEEFAAAHPKTRAHEYADERIAALQQRMRT